MKKFHIALLAITASTLAYGANAASVSGKDIQRDLMSRPTYTNIAPASGTTYKEPVYRSDKDWDRATDGQVSALTRDFVQKAASGNEFEIQLSKLALDESENDDVREFAKNMITDHTRAREDLRAALPSDLDWEMAYNEPTEQQTRIINDLRGLEDQQFDAAYIAQQRRAHSQIVALYEKYARKGDERDLRDYARNSLPTIKAHQQHAKVLRADRSTASRDYNYSTGRNAEYYNQRY